MLKKLFGFDPMQTTIKKEIVAGITTFLTMSCRKPRNVQSA